MDVKQLLKKIYNNYKDPYGISGINGLYRAVRDKYPKVRVTLKDVREFLQSEPSYTLHKLTRKRFKRRKTIASGPRKIITADLADLSSLSKYNEGVKYLLICIDVFSRYMVVTTLKTKNRVDVAKSLSNILDSGIFKGSRRLFTDEGGEFKNKQVEKLLKEHRIKPYSVYSREIKSSIAERHVRTIKEKIYKYLTLKKTFKYIDVLQDLVRAYNFRRHRGLLNNTPHSVHYELPIHKINQLYKDMYVYKDQSNTNKSQNIAVGDTVRIASTARQSYFSKSYKEVNTREIFRVRHIDQKPIRGYYLKDLMNEDIDGIFYKEELIPTKLPDKFDFKIIRSRRTKEGVKQFYVSWIGYGPKFNSYINETDVINHEG